ncbi:MAG: hypothetical protein JNK84_04600 [Phreatobacter sp.]|uniref:hypothetical protein n=1 Tax=Phreatobacter sp. TaxID=1966341 RepID=UPI001A4864D4|nr:hypothetical protein [Phreatobacter sp.]MBL8568345.1 hypothetical protein [Phreatobacter sp.]
MNSSRPVTRLRADRRFFLRAGAVSLAAVALGGCESLQDIPAMFERRQPPLPGDRQAVFPEGVPGIDRSIPQPANAPSQAPPAEQPPAEQPRRGR